MSMLKKTLSAVGAGLLLLIALSAWALSSPVGASPDDDFHLASIWCGNGEREGLCGPGDDEKSRLIPDKAANSICYAFQPETDASCQGEDFLDEGITLAESDRVNSGSQYPSGFYFWNSFFASDNIAVSTIMIRIANAALFSALTVGTWLLLPRRFRLTLSAGIALTFVPLAAFLIPSTNPSSWSIMSMAILFPALLGFFATSGAQRIALGGVAIFSALLGLGARGDSAAYTAVAICAAVVLSFRTQKRFWLSAALPAALLILAAVAFLTAGQTGVALGGMSSGAPAASKPVLLVENIFGMPMLWGGVFGIDWGLGWLDTMMPPIVWGCTLFVAAGALFLSLRWQGWRKLVAIAGTGFAALAVPLYILVQSGVTVGFEVQPRYILPLVTLFMMTAIAPSTGTEAVHARGIRFTREQTWAIAALLTIANSVALYANMRRYTGPGTLHPSGNVDWWWAAGPTPLVTWLLGSAAFGAIMALFAYTTVVAARVDTTDALAPAESIRTNAVAPRAAATAS